MTARMGGEIWMLAGRYLPCAASLVALAVYAWRARRRVTAHGVELWRERRLREELETYARVDPSLTQGLGAGLDATEAAKALAKRVCRAIAEKSAFSRVSMLLRDAEGRFAALGSVGVDDLTVAALHQWGESVVAEERGAPGVVTAALNRMGVRSFPISLGEWREFDREVGTWALSGRRERRRWRRAIVVPIRTGPGNASGRMMAAIVVCADGAIFEDIQKTARSPVLDRAMGPIEALAARIATAMENEVLAERLLRAEKLAGLGQLAGGVAHALNNPLTAVVGFAELIAETAAEPRIRRDAGTILIEALKMKDTVARLIEFWRPVTLADEAVDVSGIVSELRAACAAQLAERGVGMEIVGPAGLGDGAAPLVRGNRDRLRQMLEQLLNNAAQAIAGLQEQAADQPHLPPQTRGETRSRMNGLPRDPGAQETSHAIRISLTHDEKMLHLIVSDTGPGFREPGRAFDPFYTTRETEHGAGLGLSICFGIVREHGGVISAFNLHPRGAAVVVELPLQRTLRSEAIMMEQMGDAKFV